jgi:hypothetical protein
MLRRILDRFAYVKWLNGRIDRVHGMLSKATAELSFYRCTSEHLNKQVPELEATLNLVVLKNIELQQELRELRGDMKPGEFVTISSNAMHRAQ